MAILKRPMFRKGGSANEGIMHGLDRKGYDEGTNWEDIAKTYGVSNISGERFPGETDAYKYIDPDFINTGEGTGTPNWIKWLSDKFATDYTGPQTLHQLALEEAAEDEKYPDLSEMIKTPPGGTQLPYVKRKTDNGNQLEKIIAKKETLDEKNKRYMSMMAPHMQKRMIADAWGAASESFEKSTGDTKQDIARALGAAGRAMSDTRGIADKVSLLTLQGEIAKDIESAKEKKLSNYEYLLKMFRSDIPEERAWATQMMKKDDTSLSDLKGLSAADWKNWALSENIDNKNFGGFLPEDKKGEVIEEVKEKLDPDKFYFDQQNKMYVKLYIENGEKKIKKYIPPKK